MKETVMSKLATGYHPKPHYSELVHMEGMCPTECSEAMKAIGACTCDHLRCMKKWDEPKKMKEIERDMKVIKEVESKKEVDPKELLKMWLEEKKKRGRKKKQVEEKEVVPAPNPKFSRKGMTDEQRKERDRQLRRERDEREREMRDRLLDAKMVSMRPTIMTKYG